MTIFVKSFYHSSFEDHLEESERFRIETIDGIRTVWIRSRHYRSNGLNRAISELQFAVRAFILARKIHDSPDVIVADSVTPINGIGGYLAARARGAAFVHQIRDVWPIALVHDGSLSPSSPAYYLFRWIEKYLYRRCDWICSALPFVQDHVAESGGDPSRITYVRNGADLEPYDDQASYDGGRSREITAMYIGTIAHAHDVITIVRAASLLEQEGISGVRFLVYGDGVKRAGCEQETAKLGVKTIEFHGSIPKEEVPEKLASADVLIASVLDSDAYIFGLNLNKLYDYFASGRPVIFSGNAPNDDVKTSGAGFSISPEDPAKMADALKCLLHMSPTDRSEMGKLAREFADEEYNIRKLAGRFESMLLDAISHHNNRNIAEASSGT